MCKELDLSTYIVVSAGGEIEFQTEVRRRAQEGYELADGLDVVAKDRFDPPRLFVGMAKPKTK